MARAGKRSIRRAGSAQPADRGGGEALEALFHPASVAVVGASQDPAKVGHVVVRNLLETGYPGRIYPINPHAREILGLQAYSSLEQLPEPVDLVVVAVPRSTVIDVARQAARRGARVLMVITAGFREVGAEGRELERRLAAIVHRAGMRMLGPNVLGAIDTATPLNASFATRMPRRGHIAFLSQSGALLTAVLDWADGEGVGFSRVVSLGNKADISELDLLPLLCRDPNSQVAAAYLEGIDQGRAFLSLARSFNRTKPLLVLKAGVTSAGSRAVSSHTGSLAGSHAAYEAAFKQAGVTRARSVEELFSLALAFAQPRRPQGRRLGVITNAGGVGIIATDAAVEVGLDLPTLGSSTASFLRQRLPPAASVYNPVDVLGDAGAARYALALDALLAEDQLDAVLVLLTPQAMTQVDQTASIIIERSTRTTKPIIAAFLGGDAVSPALRRLREAGVPAYRFAEHGVGVLAALARYERWRRRPIEVPARYPVDRASVEGIIAAARAHGRAEIGDAEARRVLAAYGFATPRTRIARSEDEAVAIAREIGFPVVLKIVSPEILHKSDVGGVRTGLADPDSVRRAYSAILASVERYAPGARIQGVSVQEMVAPGREVILGLSMDPQFGHLLLFGLGGIYVEVLRDVTFRIAPITRTDAEEMVQEIRGAALLRGVRGEPPADVGAIVEGLLRLSQLAGDFPEVVELDVNPLVVHPAGKGAVAVDARIALASPEAADQLARSGA